jgi:hypothetical protein
MRNRKPSLRTGVCGGVDRNLRDNSSVGLIKAEKKKNIEKANM